MKNPPSEEPPAYSSITCLCSSISINLSVGVILNYTSSRKPCPAQCAVKSETRLRLKAFVTKKKGDAVLELHHPIITATISYCSLLISLILALSWSITSVLSLRPSSLLSSSGVLIASLLTSLGG